MKILIVQDRLRSGGTERQSILLANAFTTAGHPTTLLTFRPGGALAGGVATSVTRRALQPFDTRLDWFAPGLHKAVDQLAPDVVLCMGRMANCHAGALQKKFPQVAVVATMRTGKKLPWLYRRSLKLARHVVANSHHARANLIAQYGVAPRQIGVIHNSLVFSPMQSAGIRETVRAQHGATEKTVVLLCVAMFRPEKNQRELIEIVGLLPADLDWQLWLGGDGPARPACEKLAAQKNLGDRVKFLGWQSDPSSLYAAADVAVHASSSEALSNFLIEAQASGLPAVAYDAQGIAECFEPDDTGFVISRDDRDRFCGKIVEIAHTVGSVKIARKERACTYARTTFDHDQQVARYLELFTRLQRMIT
jgi:glycosyltransferase involved in cell wall biosynthesis